MLKTKRNRSILLFFSLFLLTNIVFCQDTIRLKKEPKVILKSWYPEFKNFPKLKFGNGKILFTIIPEFKKTVCQNNDINLKTTNSQVQIKETEKNNQYLVTLNSTDAKFIEFEIWLDLEKDTLLIYQNGKWKNAIELYKFEDNRILIETIKLEVEK